MTDRGRFLAGLDGLLHRDDAPLALALTDLDGFAAINGSYGRDGGDGVLAAWDRVLQVNVPDGGSVARLGGDEFAVVLPGPRPRMRWSCSKRCAGASAA